MGTTRIARSGAKGNFPRDALLFSENLLFRGMDGHDLTGEPAFYEVQQLDRAHFLKLLLAPVMEMEAGFIIL